ncbi:Monocopper oxidase-like protein SKU5 [Vitis vinifera]|uniref:Monocopper oxidase-like protein SKU5 n=1 Tax=Vitis vinifera TaxID=29760 RepID=A0A438ILR2_VITVI|nr:Monocopper oxidase-like protein SKU5 [Vitis vinifera]
MSIRSTTELNMIFLHPHRVQRNDSSDRMLGIFTLIAIASPGVKQGAKERAHHTSSAATMTSSGHHRWLIACTALLAVFVVGANGGDIYLEWNVAIDTTINPTILQQPVITINGMFPGPLVNASTNDFIHVNVFNNLDEPLLLTWNGIQQRLNSWQDGVSGTNCPIQPGKNWTYVFQTKDQIGTFFYFPSINFQKAAGGFGPIRVNNRIVINVPFPKPEAEFDLLIGDWSYTSYKEARSLIQSNNTPGHLNLPDFVLMNGKGPYGYPGIVNYESFTVSQWKTYRFRISNVGNELSYNFRIQNHQMVVVETEGSYTQQITLDSLDVHATPKMLSTTDNSSLVGKGVLHYANSNTPVSGPLPSGPDPFDRAFSVDQAKSIRWNMTAGAARPNPQGTFNVSNVTLSQTFILHASMANISGLPRYVVNNVSYLTPDTPLKLADQFANGSDVYQLDQFPVQSVKDAAEYGVFVATGNHKGWIELVFKNDLDVMDAWHLDGFGFYVVGFGDGDWQPELRSTYNLLDPVVRSTTQVYPGGWTAVYAFLDNPGMWNLRSQNLKNWYLGQELYVRVYDPDPNPAKERPPPENILLCGKFETSAPASSPSGPPAAPVRQRHQYRLMRHLDKHHGDEKSIKFHILLFISIVVIL